MAWLLAHNNMKIKQIITEMQRSEYNYGQSLNIDAKLRIMREFLRGNSNQIVMSIYKQAYKDKRISLDDLKLVRSIMAKHGVSGRDLETLH